jgi:signal transduction histidine kinase
MTAMDSSFLRAAVLAATPAFAHASAGAPAAALVERLGPWLFASVALVLVAWLAWHLGRWVGQREGRAQMRARLAARAGSTPASDMAPPVPAATGVTPPVTAPPPAAPAAPLADTSDAGVYAYALSHDLRAPLRVVEGFARILKEDYGRQLDKIGNDHLDRLLGAATRMHAMIEGMVALAQLSHVPLRREPVHLSQLAGFVVEDLRRNQPQRTVEVQIQPDLVAQGDPILLRQLVENLIGNAWKYSQRASPARISFGASTRDGETVYAVTDNGAGFDMRAAGKLFGLFQRLHGQSDFPGTGLGLASVQRIVLRHGGRVWAEAEPGRGARFYFTLQGSPGPRPPG